MKPNITLAKAKKLSILKWELIVAHNGMFTLEDKRNPKLRVLKHHCGFCERWRNPDTELNYDYDGSGCECIHCEFAKAAGTYCNKDESLFDQWCNDELFGGSPKSLAQQILDIIKEIPTTNASQPNNN